VNRFSLSMEEFLTITAADPCMVLTLLQVRGSPFCSRRSVGWRLRDPRTMVGSDRSTMASDLSSGMVGRAQRGGEEMRS
jgi:hypothetical protein